MKAKNKSTLILFFVLTIYIITSFIWWGYLLLEKNSQLYELQVRTGTSTEAINHYNRQVWMILGEGTVFLLFIIIGMVVVYRTIVKEMKLKSQQKNFLLSVTHELKTPIAALKLALQTIVGRSLSSGQIKELHANAANDVERLNKLVDNILLSAKLENHNYTFDKQPIDIAKTIENKISYFEQLTNRKIIFNTSNVTSVLFDRTSLDSIIGNLLDNAIKYSKADSLITISVFKKNRNIILQISDLGIGIEDAEKKQVFEKFYRIGNEEVRKQKGTGLGLYIVRELMEAHHGKIEVLDNTPQGTTFKLTFLNN